MKVAVGAKRQGEELEEDSYISRKHSKTKDLQSEGKMYALNSFNFDVVSLFVLMLACFS